MQNLDHLINSVRLALEREADAPVLEARVVGSDVEALRSLERESARRSHVAANVTRMVSKRKVTRVVITGGGLRVDLPITAPNESFPERGGERLIR